MEMSELERKLVMDIYGLQTSQTHSCGASDEEEHAPPIPRNTRYNSHYIDQLEYAIHSITREIFSLQQKVASLTNEVWVRENQIACLEKQLEEVKSTKQLEEAKSTSTVSDFV